MAGGRIWSQEEDYLLAACAHKDLSTADCVEVFARKFPPGRSHSTLHQRRTKGPRVVAELARLRSGGNPHFDLDEMPTQGPPPPDAQYEEIAESLRDYSLIDGQFVWSVNDQLVAIPFARWDAMCFDYSDHGGNLTSNEVAHKHGIARPVVSAILRKYGQFKTSPPSCRERIEENRDNLQALVDEAVDNLEVRYIRELERTKEKAWRADYEALLKGRMSETKLAEMASVFLADVPPRKPTPLPDREPDETPWMAHVPTTDEHLGKYVWAEESFGGNYDTDIACERLKRHADLSAQWIKDQPGRCTRVYRSLLGDLFHALTGETAHGTKLDQDTRGARVWTLGFEAIVYSVERMLEVSDEVHLCGCKGNHDGFDFWQFLFTLKVHFRDDPRVIVDAPPGYYGFFRVGQTVHIIDHGYGVGSLGGWKAKAMAEVTARETAGDDYHGADYIVSWYGHRHEEEVGTLGRHHRLIRIESLGESDDYETSLRYAGDPTAHVYRLDALGRPKDSGTFFADDLVA